MTAPTLLAPLLRRAEHRLPAFTRLKQSEALPITLNRRRIYILPSGYGAVLAVLLLVMLLGSLNYANNAALLLTCVLAAVAANSMLLTFATLNRLSLVAMQPGTTRAGEPLPLRLSFAGNGRKHHALRLVCGDQQRHFSVAAQAPSEIELHVPTEQRGWMPLPRLRLASRYPFGWFRAWSWLAPTGRALIYPRLERDGPAPPGANAAPHQRQPRGDEWAGLRDYRQGDPRHHIAWKASARDNALRVKQFDQPASTAPWRLEWIACADLAHEARIERLARWVHQAHTANHPWSLALPGATFTASVGAAHYHRCMRALAELP